MALASSSFIFHPPERDPTCWFLLSLLNPTSSRAEAISSFDVSFSSGSDAMKSTRFMSASSPWSLCSTKQVLTSDLSGNPSNCPLAMALINVDLPTPFLPHRPIVENVRSEQFSELVDGLVDKGLLGVLIEEVAQTHAQVLRKSRPVVDIGVGEQNSDQVIVDHSVVDLRLDFSEILFGLFQRQSTMEFSIRLFRLSIFNHLQSFGGKFSHLWKRSRPDDSFHTRKQDRNIMLDLKLVIHQSRQILSDHHGLSQLFLRRGGQLERLVQNGHQQREGGLCDLCNECDRR
ncbi:hypothetical protein OGATHE_001592 [Ogataea polymorpha]|uniref:Uncharacterized protein n=1 Tax=Ogataea polymorpha TaxID=460523 RepID=A0A9P8PPH9_9ASCO|nr:hypothetical protein OGATHE_001592 [Ogataea polymorpha]